MRMSRKNKQLLNALNDEYEKWDGESGYEPNDYLRGRQNAKANDRLLFIHGNPSGERAEIIEQLAKQALEKEFKIALVDKWKKKLGKNKKISYMKKNSVEYFQLLTEAKYIYATSNLHYHYSKTDGQVMIVDLPSYDRADFDNRVKIDSICSHADWVVTDEMSRQKIFEKLLALKLKNKKEKRNKKNVLFILNTTYYARTFEYILSIQNQIDYSKYDVTILFAVSAKDKYAKQMHRLNPEIHVVFRRGNVLCDAEEDRKLSFLDEKNFELPDVSVVASFLNSDIYVQETRRLFGIKRFDYVFNMKYDGIKWRLFIHALSGKKVFYNLDKYDNPSVWTLSKLKHLSMYDEILFPNEDRRKLAIEMAPEVFGRISYVVAPPRVCAEENVDVKHIMVGENRFCLADINIISEGDLLDALVIKYPEEKTPYVTISPGCTEAYAEERLKEILNNGTCPIVFDFGRVLLKNEITDEVDYYIRYGSSYALSQMLSECIPIESDMPKRRGCSLDVILSQKANK
ncbi:MAG: hypothetical protein K2G45_08615 [Lachnospiraceae bacterium]|nr:hypothetical protein [Lachnospiraceae bacterium]